MTKIIENITNDIMSPYMNPPEPPGDISYIGFDKEYKKWICCPKCGAKQFPITDKTKIEHLPWKCKHTKCKEEFNIKV